MKRKVLLGFCVLVVLTAMVTFPRCGAAVGGTSGANVGFMKF